MHIHIKICGFTEPVGLQAALDAGVDSIGLVLDPSPRQLTIKQAVALAQHIPDGVDVVAVCGRPSVDEVSNIAAGLSPTFIQLMADALPPAECGFSIIPAFEDGGDLLERVSKYCDTQEHPQPLVLADGPRPGSGVLADWDRVERLSNRTRLMLAGGLNADNVTEAILRMKPFGVDVSSGVESSPGVKDPEKIRAFVAAVRHAEALLDGEV